MALIPIPDMIWLSLAVGCGLTSVLYRAMAGLGRRVGIRL